MDTKPVATRIAGYLVSVHKLTCTLPAVLKQE